MQNKRQSRAFMLQNCARSASENNSGLSASKPGGTSENISPFGKLWSRRAALFAGAFFFLLPSAAGSTLAAPGCGGHYDALGTSRELVLDTTGGPRYGQQQYKVNDFLKEKEIVLTFDDGPSRALTKSILAALAKHCTKATFFMVGRMAKSDPRMVREVASYGHTVATHTWSHQNLNRRSKARGIREIELGISAVSKALGKPAAPFFRFPYLADPNQMRKYLETRNVGAFSIDIDSKDYRTSSGDRVARKIMRDLKRAGKGIILFHDIQRSTARAIPALLRKLQRKGYKVVHIKPKSAVKTLAKYDAMINRDTRTARGDEHDHSAERKTARSTRGYKKRGSKYRPRAKRRKTAEKTTKAAAKPQWPDSVFSGG